MRIRFQRTLAAHVVLLTWGGLAQASDYYVSPTGTASGNGSINAPWDLHTALAHPAAVKPGDALWLRGGTYAMKYPAEFWSKLTGTSAAPIVVRRYPGEAVVIDLKSMASSLYVYGAHTWFWGLEITSTGIPRSTGTPGPWSILNSSVEVHGPGTKFINCYVHDLSQGLSFWKDSVGGEAYGNIVYHVGWQGPDRGHGHAVYSQNAPGGASRKVIAENFMGEAFDIGLQLYGSGAAVIQDYYLAGNVVWDNGIPTGQNVDQIVIAGGGTSKKNLELDTNYVYNSGHTGLSRIGWQWDGRNGDVNVHGNWFIGGYNPLEIWHWDRAVFRNNFVCADAGFRQLFIGLYQPAGQLPSAYDVDQNRYCNGTMRYAQTALDAGGQAVYLSGSDGSVASYIGTTGFDRTSTFGAPPVTGADPFVRPNKYETGRANIIIFNWQKQANVMVDLTGSGLKDGDSWVIRDAQNFNGPVVTSGVFSLAYPKATIPMGGLPKAQISGWGSAIPHTAPAFGTFVLLGGSALSGGGTPAPTDMVPPVVSITAPAGGQTVSGSITLRASATDNVGVASVQFNLDGAILGAPVYGEPYQLSWNTVASANGAHSLTATARDAAGNQTTSAAIAVTVSNAAQLSAAAFVKQDDATRGNWKSAYGKDGALIASDVNRPPSYGQVGFSGASLYVWNPNTSSPAGLQSLGGGRIASTWYQGGSFTLDVNFSDALTHQIALYMLDFDSTARTERIEVVNPTNGVTLDSRTLGGFNQGRYLVWNASGRIRFQITRIAGANCVVSGVFFGDAPAGTPVDSTPPTIAITSPTANQTVSGTVAVSASASDNVGVAGVQFTVDGAASGAEKTTAPYTFSWNSVGVSNGLHTLSTVARDAAGNTSTASVTVNVANAAPPSTLPAPSGYWTMNAADTISGTELDKSTNGLNLSAFNVTTTAGRFREALAFNGRNAALVSNSAPAMDLTSSMTLSAWVNTTNATRQEAIISKYDTAGTESGYLLKTTAAGVLAFRAGGKNTPSGSREVTDSKKVNDGLWHHVAVVITLGQAVTFYVDGVQTSSQALPSRAASSIAAFEIGAIVYPYYATFFTGAIDEVKVYKSALSSAQVEQLAAGL